MQEEIKAVLFDLDGTLLDTLSDLTDSVNAALEKYHLPTHSKEAVQSFVGNGIRNLMIKATPEGEATENFEELFLYFKEYYKSHCDIKTEPYEDIMELMKALKEKNIQMAIISNKYDLGVKALNEKFFAEYTEAAIGEREGIRRKPAPDSVLEVLRLLNLKKEQAIYVGDSDVDIETAKNAGIPCVSVTWGFRDAKYLKEQGATILIDRPLELLDLL